MYVRGKHSGSTVWWCEDNKTGKRESLRTTDKREAKRLLDLKNEPQHFKGFHVQMARTHLLVSDPQGMTRTWQTVMDAIISQKTGTTKARWERAAESKAFDLIRKLVIANTISAWSNLFSFSSDSQRQKANHWSTERKLVEK